MAKLYRVLSWIFGVWAVIAGLALFTISILGGIAFILIGALLLPPVRAFAFTKINATLSGTTRGVLIAILFIGGIAAMGNDAGDVNAAREADAAKAQAEKIAATKQANLTYFTQNKATVLAQLQAKHDSQDYQGVVRDAGKYLATNDADLLAIHNAAKTKVLLTELNAIKIEPANFGKLQTTYQQLAKLDPATPSYQADAAYYAKQVQIVAEKQKAEAAKAAQAEARKKELEKQFSAWDGSHPGVERYIKKVMNDPDSYAHDETRYIDRGDYLIVITQFRGKNAFGGVVRNTVKAKVDLAGNVLEIID